MINIHHQSLIIIGQRKRKVWCSWKQEATLFMLTNNWSLKHYLLVERLWLRKGRHISSWEDH